MNLKLKSTLLSALYLATIDVSYATEAQQTQKTIGETTSLIAEAGLSDEDLKDGASGNVNFPFAVR